MPGLYCIVRATVGVKVKGGFNVPDQRHREENEILWASV